MNISLIICTRNRAEQLRKCLGYIENAAMPDSPVEVIVVDNRSEDHTQSVISDCATLSKWPMKTVMADQVGLGYARNRGIEQCTGDIVIFTDDDCYVERDYFINFNQCFDESDCQYGMGQVLLFDSDDDPGVANRKIEQKILIPAATPVVPAGAVQGANMFFLREVFQAIGLFNEDMGAGTAFPCEDIEMACRASHHGFTGALLPGFTVYHHHGKKHGSPEAIKTINSYDIGRGAYYANLLSKGSPGVWEFWQSKFSALGGADNGQNMAKLSREFSGAALYIDFLVNTKQAVPDECKGLVKPRLVGN